jgi:cyclase
MADVVEHVARQVFIPLTVGGGLRSLKDMRLMLEAGADKVSVNTAAVNNPQLLSDGASRFGSQCIVLAIDAMRNRVGEDTKWLVCTQGGRKQTALDAVEWAKTAVRMGTGEILLTSWDSDGRRAGYDLELTSTISRTVSVPVIASGGAGNLEHLYDAIMVGKADAVLAASIFHYGNFTIREAKQYLQDRGIPIRM